MINVFKKFYCVKQQDAQDCGCACLATICKQYGKDVSLAKLREIAGTDQYGTTIFGMMEASEKLGLDVKCINSKKIENLYKKVPFPLIAHIVIDNNRNHYIVIHKVTKKYILVADPSKGMSKYTPEEFMDKWTGILIFLYPNANFMKLDKEENKTDVKDIFFKFLKSEKKVLANILFASILIAIIGIGGSFYYKILIDNILVSDIKNTLNVVSIAFVILNIFGVILNGVRTQLILHFTQHIDAPLMLDYFEHVINLPMNFFSTRQSGEIISRFNDVTNIKIAITEGTVTVVMDGLMCLIGGFVLYFQNHRLFYITIVPVVFYIIIVLLFKGSLEKVNKQNMENNSAMSAYFFESINGEETIKSFNAENQVINNAEKKLIKFINSIFRKGYLENVQSTIKTLVKSIFGIVILWMGAYEVIDGNIGVGELMAFNALLIYFLNPVENLINLQSKIQTAIVAAKRLCEIMNLKVEKDGKEDNKLNLDSLKGDIKFENVKFRYGARNLILNDITICIPNGKKIALVGESGSGKTTLVRLLMNFYQCEEGKILIDNYNVEDIKLETLRNKIAYISQDIFLFSGTIRENICIGIQHKVELSEIIDACKKAQIHDYINSLHLGYEAKVVEKGANLSGGQKQRIAIARALLRNPDILIMDEATSSLDSVTESAIENTINEISKNITTIIIAHRLSTITNCDYVYVINKGMIDEEGTHEELISKKGSYYTLLQKQMVLVNNGTN
ncbi:peptidase domain-containing ABC transporter [Clostridium paraputrificum]|uniref:peptidase domain-containing ABC transporter n=1 Tax=Clostridium paraputrificum TaxID=29363 RepID=UPI003D34C9EF